MKRTQATWILAVLSLSLLASSCGGGGSPIIEFPDPELTLVKTAAPVTFDSVGDVISYTFVVANTGNVSISGPITIDDDVAGDEDCPDLTSVGNGDDLLDPLETITCSASHTITQADRDAGSVTNTATASGTDPRGNPVTSAPDSAQVVGPLLATFTADPPSGGARITMQPGPSADEGFTVEIESVGITDLYGVGFTLLYDPTKATWLGCDAQGSILTSAAGSIPCDDSLVGGAKFSAALQNGMPGILNVRASKDGLVPGVPAGSGLLLTLSFEVLVAIPAPGEPFTFEVGASREVVTCPQDLSPCSMPVVPWDGGTLTAVGN